MEEVENASSGGLWDAMRSLTNRPRLEAHLGVFQDLEARGQLNVVVPDDETRWRAIEHYNDLDALRDAAANEYRELYRHYERVLGSGEWRSVFGFPRAPGEAFGVDYRATLRLLFEDNHEAVLRGLLRVQREYLADVSEALEKSTSLQNALLGIEGT
jgi:hypothetical protein